MRKQDKQKMCREIFDRYSRLVMKIAVDAVHDYALAQDICQEVFIKLFTRPEMNNWDESVFKPWLIVTARHQALDHLRRAYVRHETSGFLNTLALENLNGIDDTLQMVMEKDFREKVLTGLYRKNEGWYRLVMEVLVFGKSQEEVAAELGISIVNLRTRLCRAKSWIRERYGNEYTQI